MEVRPLRSLYPNWYSGGGRRRIIEHRPAAWLAQQILPLARTYTLSAYDTAYLELAIREGLPLGALDDYLRQARVRRGRDAGGRDLKSDSPEEPVS